MNDSPVSLDTDTFVFANDTAVPEKRSRARKLIHEAVLEAIRLQECYQLSYWDAQIIASARFAKATLLYSEDLQHGAEYEGVRIQNPFQKQA